MSMTGRTRLQNDL